MKTCSLLPALSLLTLFAASVAGIDCGNGYTECAPAGASFGRVPILGDGWAFFYQSLISVIPSSPDSQSKRNVDSLSDGGIEPRLTRTSVGNVFCCMASSMCVLIPSYDLPACYDKFTTNYFLSDGSHGTVSNGTYETADGGWANLVTGEYSLTDGTEGNIYANDPANAPDSNSVPVPTPFTSSGDRILGDDLPLAPARLFARLAHVPNYTWDHSLSPFRSTYDHWHVVGILHRTDADTPQQGSSLSTLAGRPLRSSSQRSSPKIEGRPTLRHTHWSSMSGYSEQGSESSSRSEPEALWTPVVARISTNVLRLEREYNYLKSLIKTVDPDCQHTITPIDIFRLPTTPGDPHSLLVCVYRAMGKNFLRELLELGPAFGGGPYTKIVPWADPQSDDNKLRLDEFFDFAIGVCECLELLHHGAKAVHGEIRQDTFHWNKETNEVKLINGGNGPRAFENLLSREGWATLSREVGVKTKLQFIAPEQTGRLVAEPDSRTDIYSLGILFWAILTGKYPFEGDSPIDIVQKVLSSRLPQITSLRIDLPDTLAHIIAKMTHKQMDSRYHSVSGLKSDLLQLQKYVEEGDQEKVRNFKIAQHDVSSFFILPTKQYGRQSEGERIMKIIDRVHKLQAASGSRANTIINGLRSTTSLSSIAGDQEDGDIVDGTDSSSSRSFTLKESRSNSATIGIDGFGPSQPFSSKAGTFPSFGRGIAEPRNSSIDFPDSSSFSGTYSHQSDTLGAMAHPRNSHKFRRTGKTEVISLFGQQGSGKTTFIRSVQPHIRRHGYFAYAKFDRARPTPFEPMVKAMGSLIRQIFSERDVSSSYHEHMRAHVRPFWSVLQNMLDLPDSLLDMVAPSTKGLLASSDTGAQSIRTDVPSVETRGTVVSSISPKDRDANDFLRGPVSTKSIRFIHIYLDVLRVMCTGKVICMSLDDLQVADQESLDLILNIIRAKIPVVLIFATRTDDQLLAEPVQKILDLDSTQKIEIGNLREKHVFDYVADTMSQPLETVLPLAAVVYEKSGGNPYMMREILKTCYQRDCLWYDWRISGWQFDLDKIFTELSGSESFDINYITKQMQQLAPASRYILAWASLIGTSFSFRLIQEILTGRYFYSSGHEPGHDLTCPHTFKMWNLTETECIEALQYLVNLYVIMPGDVDDEFKFTNSRYLQAANAMRECHNTAKMHFVITQAMMSYLSECRSNLYSLARHICLSAHIIRGRVVERATYREVLWRGAHKAAESGAHATALSYYKTSISLLQPDKWATDRPDVFYDETLQLYVNTAEMMYEADELDQAVALLDESLENARCAADKTRSYLLQARIRSKQRLFLETVDILKLCLGSLGFELPDTSWEEQDIEYNKVKEKIAALGQAAIVHRPLSEDKEDIAIGTVLSDSMGASYFYSALMWYQLVIAYCRRAIDGGNFVQAGIGFNMLGAVAISRHKDLQLGIFYGEIAQSYYETYDDGWSRGRGWTLYALFLGHFQTPMRNLLPILDNALEYSLASADTFASTLNIGSMALSRLWAGQDLVEVEAFCNYGPEEIVGWEFDARGGSLVTATRLVASALQGKTDIRRIETVLDSANFKLVDYLAAANKYASNPARSHDIIEAGTIIVFYVYGYYQYVVDLGRKLMATTLDELSSHRAVGAVRFFTGLSCTRLAVELPREERGPLIEEACEMKKFIDDWGSFCDVNYAAWSYILDAGIAQASAQHIDVISKLEAAIDHSQVHGFAIDEAIALEMQAEFVLSRGAKRAGRAMVEEAMAAWNRISAMGKAKHLAEKHEWLLKTATVSRTADAAVQTNDVGNMVVVEQATEQSTRDYTNDWVQKPKSVSSGAATQDVPGMGLDILDLTSILEFSRIISSELQINSLLSKMISVLLESVGGQAEFCAIVIDHEEQGWCIAASADHDHGVKTYPDGIPFAEVDDQVAQQITHYVLRTRDTVFLHNVLEDDRFANVGDSWLQRNPQGRSIICIPIQQADHLMGLIHLEGRPHTFTPRNMVVLNLLSSQVAISLGNALLYRKVRKVSASNASMVESQKRALVAAREAEAKAKRAEAEAMQNVKLKEEAARAKSIFLANVSHELRTPLNGVIGMSELLKGTPLSKDQEGYADSIRVCADTLLTVINDILDFSKLEAGKMQMFTVPLNLKETITEVVRALAYTNQERGLQTIEDLMIDDGLVLGDPVRLHQIFMNLLSNAYKFTPQGSVTVKARKITETKDKVKITCTVADTGIGITQEQLSRLFQPFSQADSSTARSYGGSGLGLSICKAMIENVLGGKIWIESTPGVGTAVSFTLTFKRAPKDSKAPNDMKIVAKDPDPMASWSQAASPRMEEVSGRFVDLSKIPREKIKVCIAEDNAINRKIAISYVKKLGMTCEAYEDGKLACEALQRRSKEGDPFHLVLMDVQMPVLDGYEATKAIRRDPDPNVNQVLIIAMTASAIRGDREKCLDAGMNDYLAKPVRQNVLKAMLDEYINNTRSALAAAKDLDAPSLKAKGREAVNGVEARSPTFRRPIKKTTGTGSYVSDSTMGIVANGKTRHDGNILGGALLGAGMSLTGACPGTVLVQLGVGVGVGGSVLIYEALCLAMILGATHLPRSTHWLHPVAGGVGIGLAQVLSILLTRKSLGVSGAYADLGRHVETNPLVALLGGVIMIFGARLAGGCTSGHGISGMSTMSISSFITVAAMFGGGILTAALF
ncbi:hypothetical protein DV735_g1398, partial [Chaetothyriales sp. CBS 134920]